MTRSPSPSRRTTSPSQIQSSGLSAKPSVNIEGWPFLTQVAAHDVKAIDISANNVTASGSKVPVQLHRQGHRRAPQLLVQRRHRRPHQRPGASAFSSVDHACCTDPEPALTFTADPAKGPNAVKADLGIAAA